MTIAGVVLMAFACTISQVQAVPISRPQKAPKWRESEEEDGFQIWIEAGDFDYRDKNENMKRIDEAEDMNKGDGYISVDNNGVSVKVLDLGDVTTFEIAQEEAFSAYEFRTDAAEVLGYIRIRDLRGGGNSWWVGINPDKTPAAANIGTSGAWVWASFLINLEPKVNTIVIGKREADQRGASLVDMIVISTVTIKPTEEMYQNATQKGVSVERKGKLTTTWGDMKML